MHIHEHRLSLNFFNLQCKLELQHIWTVDSKMKLLLLGWLVPTVEICGSSLWTRSCVPSRGGRAAFAFLWKQADASTSLPWLQAPLSIIRKERSGTEPWEPPGPQDAKRESKSAVIRVKYIVCGDASCFASHFLSGERVEEEKPASWFTAWDDCVWNRKMYTYNSLRQKQQQYKL